MCRQTRRCQTVASFPDSTTIRFMPSSTTSDARKTAEDKSSWAGDYAEIGREAAADLGETIEHWVGARPLPSVLIAGGVGFALGWLWTWTRRQ